MQALDFPDESIYQVVINHEQQYSIRAVSLKNPEGWCDVGQIGTKQQCFDYIDAQWLDMRPLSLRNQLDVAVQTSSESHSSWKSGVGRWWDSIVSTATGASRGASSK